MGDMVQGPLPSIICQYLRLFLSMLEREVEPDHRTERGLKNHSLCSVQLNIKLPPHQNRLFPYYLKDTNKEGCWPCINLLTWLCYISKENCHIQMTYFQLIIIMFCGHTHQWPELIPDPALKDHSGWCSGNCIWCRGLKLGELHATQVPYLLTLSLAPVIYLFFYHTQWCSGDASSSVL